MPQLLSELTTRLVKVVVVMLKRNINFMIQWKKNFRKQNVNGVKIE